MRDLDELIDEAREGREVKRAVSVKMGQQGVSPAQICQVLNVSPQYASKWKGHYEAEGAAALRLSNYSRSLRSEEREDWRPHEID